MEDRAREWYFLVQAEIFGGYHSWESLRGSQGCTGTRDCPGFRMEEPPQRLFLFTDITRLPGQVPSLQKGVKRAERAVGQTSRLSLISMLGFCFNAHPHVCFHLLWEPIRVGLVPLGGLFLLLPRL